MDNSHQATFASIRKVSSSYLTLRLLSLAAVFLLILLACNLSDQKGESGTIYSDDWCNRMPDLTIGYVNVRDVSNNNDATSCDYDLSIKNRSDDATIPVVHRHSVNYYSQTDAYEWVPLTSLSQNESTTISGFIYTFPGDEGAVAANYQRFVSYTGVLNSPECQSKLNDKDWLQRYANALDYPPCKANEPVDQKPSGELPSVPQQQSANASLAECDASTWVQVSYDEPVISDGTDSDGNIFHRCYQKIHFIKSYPDLDRAIALITNVDRNIPGYQPNGWVTGTGMGWPAGSMDLTLNQYENIDQFQNIQQHDFYLAYAVIFHDDDDDMNSMARCQWILDDPAGSGIETHILENGCQ